jgi:uncharacterized protein (TIGR02145 family)
MYWNGSAWVTLNPGSNGQSLTLCNGALTWTTGGVCPAALTTLNCAGAVNTGTLTAGTAATGVSSSVPYTGGNGASYSAQSVGSTGVTGLTATLSAGTLASGAGSLNYVITGTPSGSGTATFALSLGGQSCTLTRSVNVAVATLNTLNCAGAVNTGTLTAGAAASGASSNVSYTGGNGASYSAQSVSSTGVTGLTATLAAGTLNSGSGLLSYFITGTPSSSGTASFALSLGGRTCTLERIVCSYSSSSGTMPHSCGVQNVHNTALTYRSMTDQQGNAYKTIVIGTQEWMAENLNTSIYRNGDAIPTIFSNAAWENTINTQQGAWAYFNHDASYACPYGKLYNWYACADARQLCPVGWHVPTDAEWTELIDYLGGESVAGGKMKTTGTSTTATGLWYFPNSCADNSSGFSGIPGALRGYAGEFLDIGPFGVVGMTGSWWSSSEYDDNSALYRRLSYDAINVDNLLYDYNPQKLYGFSVRCLRD